MAPSRAAPLLGRSGECGLLDRILRDVQAGQSRVLLLRGEPGVGKTALLDYLAGRAAGCRVARAAGVQSEMELAFAGLHQLCAPMLADLDRLPGPQRDALRTAFGISAGPAPDRFLVGLAVLSLLAETAATRPLVCVVDDEQWLDRESARALGFVARRLAAEPVGLVPVGLVFAARVAGAESAGLPELFVAGLREGDAATLLESMLTGPLDAQVRDQIIAETRGNPLALLELPRGLTPAQLAGGFGLPGARPLAGQIEESFRRQLDALAPGSRRLLQLAAADPVGEPLLVWRAATRLGIGTETAAQAVEAGLIEFGAQIRFRHPLVRSAAYRSASLAARQAIHRALADVTDPAADPDRRAWHLAHAAPGPDEDVAAELERSAGRAQARGGLAAAAAFSERAALLTPEPARRAQRLLTAARAQRDAGAPDVALGLLVAVEAGPPDARRAAEVDLLRGQIAFDQRRGTDAARLLLNAARCLEPLDVGLARETHLESLVAAMWTADLDSPGVQAAAEAARAAPPAPEPPRAVDFLLDVFALRFTQGYAAAAPAMARAVELLLALDGSSGDGGRWLRLAGGRASGIIAVELWDFDSWQRLAAGQVRFAREAGALVHLQFALSYLARIHILTGELAEAAQLIDEDRLIAAATGNPPVADTAMMLAAWRGQEQEASALIEAAAAGATARGLGMAVDLTAYASAVLYNGLGQPAAARDAARRACERHDTEPGAVRQAMGREPVGFGPLVVPEMAEAAVRTGDVALAEAALGWLSERTGVLPTQWALGIEARIRALLSEGAAAEELYRESIGRLAGTRVRAELARAHLLYGEWLRRERRRSEAREQLRAAAQMLGEMGIEGFAERARRELAATGETARKRTVPVGTELTAQEMQVARLVRDGLSNPEIGVRMFISTRTVQYHLGKVFTKLGISSRAQLGQGTDQGAALARSATQERDPGASTGTGERASSGGN
jgi:DNA-binding CsgD family transcriptional regulator